MNDCNATKLVFCLACILTVCLSCNRGESPEGGNKSLQGAVLILLDTVRADRLSCYGYHRNTTPHIDKLAAQGVCFTNVLSNAPWTLPGVAALLTGEYPERIFSGKLTWSAAECFRKHGFVTAAFTEGGYVSRHFGFDRGFTHYEEEEGPVQLLLPGMKPRPKPAGGIAHTFSRAEQWLRKNRLKPFFIFIHTYEPHTPYTNQDFTADFDRGVVGPVFSIPFLARLQSGRVRLSPGEIAYVNALYDGGIRNSDRYVGRFLSLLEELDLTRTTLVAITSDHGEEMGEHYLNYIGDHGHCLHDSLLKVPLIIRDPTRTFHVRKITQQLRTIDIMPTIAELVGIDYPRPVSGRSILPVITGRETGERPAFSANTSRGPGRASMRYRGYTYIECISDGTGPAPPSPPPPMRQLYNTAKDPLEKNNIVDSEPEMTTLLHAMLKQHLAILSHPEAGTLPVKYDRALLERLKSLGYVR